MRSTETKVESQLRRLVHKSLTVAGLGIAIVAVAFATLVAINAFDEDLSAEAKTLLVKRAPQMEEGENAFHFAMGFMAKEGADPVAQGKRYVSLARKNFALGAAAERGFSSSDGLRISKELNHICDWHKQDCYVIFQRDAQLIAKHAIAHRTLLNRYDEMSRFKGMQTLTPPSIWAPVPHWSYFLAITNLSLGLAIADAKRGNFGDSVNRLERGFTLWRQLLATSDSWLTTAVAVAALQRHTIVAMRLAGDYPRNFAAAKVRFADWLRPLSDAERDVTVPMRSDLLALRNFTVDARRDPQTNYNLDPGSPVEDPRSRAEAWLRSFFIRPNATTNLVANLQAEALKIASDPATRHAAALVDLPVHRKALLSAMGKWPVLLNPEGLRLLEILESYNFMSYEPLLPQVTDLDLHLRVAGLATEIRAKEIPADEIVPFLSRTGKNLNPYTGLPFSWDAVKQEISAIPLRKERNFSRDGKYRYALGEKID